ncbi:hypothetical protein F5Y06DRAFT_253740 [Hypoxylon sp. FL0890]|nr:hypothetical protein F5Y06DRAFT_253740 [Hypoxylon sp. FL0890]
MQILLRNISSASGVRGYSVHRTSSAVRARLAKRVERRYTHHHPRIPQPWNMLHRRINWPFIGANGLVFLWWGRAKMRADEGLRAKSADPSHYEAVRYMIDNYTLSIRNLREGRWYTILTSAISHYDFSHLIFNMISFNTFTRCAIEIGGLRAPTILALGVGSAIASGTAWIFEWYRKGTYDMSGLGASGVVSGIGSAMACMMPKQRFNVFFIPVGIPLWALMLGYIAYDSYGVRRPEKSNIGHAAHLGGAAFGALFYALRLRRW